MANKEKIRPISTVGGRIQHLRLQQGMSREELHERLTEKGVGHLQSYNPASKKSTIAYLERGYYPNGRPCRPTFEEICALCDIFGCSADYLLVRMEEKTHDAHFVCEYTGLTEKAAEKLHTIATLRENHENMSFNDVLLYFGRCDGLIISLLLEYADTFFVQIAKYLLIENRLEQRKLETYPFVDRFDNIQDWKNREILSIIDTLNGFRSSIENNTAIMTLLSLITGYTKPTKEERYEARHGIPYPNKQE